MTTQAPTIPSATIAAFCRRRHIRRLSFFGSLLREDFGPESDVDVLVEFEPGRAPGLMHMVEMEQELTAILGRKSHVRTPAELGREFRYTVLREALLEYSQP